MFKKSLFILIIAVAIGAPTAYFITARAFPTQQGNAVEIRAALDIGSGSTKMKVAQVDVKAGKIAKMILSTQAVVPFEEELQQSKNDSFDTKIKNLGITKFNELKLQAENLGAKKVAAVATAAFREAKNSAEYVKEIKEKTGIDVIVITQDQEGEVAFRGAVASCPGVCNQSAITWDIGGGSYQITTQNDEEKIIISEGTFASVSFQNYVIGEIQGHDIKKATTPNPLSKEDAGKARSYAAEYAKSHIDPFILQKIKESHGGLIGVGSVFNKNIKSYLVKKQDRSIETPISKDSLNQLINQLIGLDDAALKKKLQEIYLSMNDKESSSDNLSHSIVEGFISNLLYVAGFMDGMDVDSLYIMDINNADGVLVYPRIWR